MSMFSLFSLTRTASELLRVGAYESAATWPEALQNNVQILSNEEIDTIKMLLEMGQLHLFASWDPAGTSDDLKHALFEQIKVLNSGYVGGIGTYVRRAKQLLADAKAGVNPFDGFKPEVPSGIKLEPFTPEYERYERQGLAEVGKCGFVLVAGGLGERLGYNGIKVELPSETLTGTCYLELYCQQILYMQKRYAAPGMQLPLAIMVSEDTATKTEALLIKNSYFGLQPEQVTLMMQGKVPALLSNSAHIALASKYVIEAKPHGHGDVHALLHSTGTAKKWAEAGIEWVNFFQDTNGLAFFALPAMIGVSVELDLQVNSLSIKRIAKQAIGAIAKLVRTSGYSAAAEGKSSEMTINVEYNQLDPLLRATVSPDGDVNDPNTGCSPYPGNINQLLFKMEPYVAMLEKTQGVMPEFVNPKYADESKTLFKKPTRLECMMQDYPKLLAQDAKVGFTTVPSWLCYSACKNNSKDAAVAVSKGIPAASPFTAESDQYFVHAEMLRRLGVDVQSAPEVDIGGIRSIPSPRVVIHPSCAIFPCEVKSRFTNPAAVRISPESALVMRGDVAVHHLQLDGALVVDAASGSIIDVKAGHQNHAAVTNAGYQLQLIPGSSSSSNSSSSSGNGAGDSSTGVRIIDTMRGYVLQRKEECVASSALFMKLPKAADTDADVSVVQGFVFNGKTLIAGAAYEGDKAESNQCCTSCI